MKIIDGHTGEYHITSQQIADSNMAIFGDGDYVFDIGNKFALDVVSASEVMLNDGVLIMQGRRAITPAGERTALSIANGAQGVQRNDIIIARYTIDSGDIESVDFAIVQGVNDGEDPEITTGNIRNGASLHEMPMYRVRLDGINITGVDTLFKGVSKIREILDGLSKKYIIDHISQSGWEIDKYNDGTWEGWIKGTTAAIQFTSATALGTNVYQMRNAANAIKIPALPIGY
ncbi:MAG: hypothetical protein FWF33_00455, partial [Clostridiales bacterium]|nr:hypothetical protein [Clostridiales bacterium]